MKLSGHPSPSRESDKLSPEVSEPERQSRDRMALANGPRSLRCRAEADCQRILAKCRGHGSPWSLSVTLCVLASVQRNVHHLSCTGVVIMDFRMVAGNQNRQNRQLSGRR
jgi:hypothetical protein